MPSGSLPCPSNNVSRTSIPPLEPQGYFLLLLHESAGQEISLPAEYSARRANPDFYFFKVCVSVLLACVYTWYLKRTEEGIEGTGSPGTGITSSGKSPVGAKNQQSSARTASAFNCFWRFLPSVLFAGVNGRLSGKETYTCQSFKGKNRRVFSNTLLGCVKFLLSTCHITA